MKQHTDLINEIVHKGNKIPGCCLWTNPTSFAYVGKGSTVTGNHGKRYLVIPNGTGQWFGLCRGSADIIGFYNTPVGIPGIDGTLLIPRFVAIEVKIGSDKLRPEQLAFKKVMQDNNAIYGIARKIEDLYSILGVEYTFTQ